jgi:D-3-phosphoglycerate dehydrogenase
MMKVVVTDHGFPDVNQERELLAAAGAQLVVAQCRTTDDVIEAARDADGLLVQWAPVSAEVVERLERCRVIVRYGIGYDNVAVAAARARGIPVCNVPDYGIDEVAEHAVALALALHRRLPQVDARTRSGLWKIVPDRPVKALRETVFATAGFGRIARAVHVRMAGFGVPRIAYDPFVSAERMRAEGVEPVSKEALFERADILSLHLPLVADTRHFVDASRLACMRTGAVLINTARGGLVDTRALAAALQAGTIGGAGIDVYEIEPLEVDHPLRGCPDALLTSHVAWYSESSIPRLQRLAAEEVVRGLRGEPLLNRIEA